MTSNVRLTLAVLATLTLAACGKDSGTGPSDGSGSGGMTAKVGGQNFSSASLTTNGSWIRGAFGVVGTTFSGGTTKQINITLHNVTEAGTYSLSSSYTNSATYTEAAGPEDLKTWIAGPETGSGTVIITSIDSKGAKGTFNITMVPAVGLSEGSPNLAITNGSFNVKFSN